MDEARESRARREDPRRYASAEAGCRRSPRPASSSAPSGVDPRRSRSFRPPRVRSRSAAARAPREAGRCLRQSPRAWDLRSQPRAATLRAPDAKLALESFDAVGETAQARAELGVGATDPVIRHLDHDQAIHASDLDGGRGRLRVLPYVREAFGHEVEGSDLEALRKPAGELHFQPYRHGRSRGEL